MVPMARRLAFEPKASAPASKAALATTGAMFPSGLTLTNTGIFTAFFTISTIRAVSTGSCPTLAPERGASAFTSPVERSTLKDMLGQPTLSSRA